MKTLELKFRNQQNRIVTLTLDDPIEPINEQAIRAAMDQIIAIRAFSTAGGSLVEKASARVIERQIEEIEL